MDYRAALPKRNRDAHKGQCGRIGIIAGTRMPGAAVLAALGALRVGAGFVYVISDHPHAAMMAIRYPELIVLSSKDPWPELDAVVVGPGLGEMDDALCSRLLKLSCPFVVDADALVAEFLARLIPHRAVLTPHPGEFSRLWGPVGEDRVLSAQRAARQSRQVVLLKGAGSVVADGTHTHVNPTGNAGMATAGAGDVLAGVIGGFLGQGLTLWDAAMLGAYWHGVAGDLAFQKYGNGLIASDIALFVAQGINGVELRGFSGRPEAESNTDAGREEKG